MAVAQTAYNAVAKGESRTVRATFNRQTSPGSLIVLVLTAVGGKPVTSKVPDGFEKAHSIGTPRVHLTIWYQENAPSTTQVFATSPEDRSLQLRALEIPGVRQADALDFAIGKVAPHFHTGDDIDTGLSPTTAQDDSTVLGVVTNDYASTTQFGFSGGFTRLFDTVSPSDTDSDRSRLTIHHIGALSKRQFRLLGSLSAERQWIAMLLAFKGGATGPKQLSSRNAPPIITIGGSGARAALTAFGPLRSTTAPPVITVGGAGSRAKIDVFDYQYRLNNALTIGAGTDYDVRSHEGLEGWVMRTSDEDQPRADGAQRGVDLQSAREIMFEVELVGDLRGGVEAAVDKLYRVLKPRRGEDWPLEWRHPGRGVKIVHVRPTNLVRQLDHNGTVLTVQQFLLRAADPRHYSIRPHLVTVPVAAAGDTEPATVTASNSGNADAYPIITIKGAATTVSRVQLVNTTADVTFDVAVPIVDGSVLIGDMPARITSAPRSSITLDGASKYGAWQFPRQAFYLEPGDNELHARTTPEGVPVEVTVDYRDTWAG